MAQGLGWRDGCSIWVVSCALWVAAVGARAAEPLETEEMGEIVVTATRTEKEAREVPGSIQVIGKAELEAANARNVDELFKTVLGVDLQGGGFPGSPVRLNMRGLTTGYQSQRVLVLVDGRRINEQYQGNVEFALLPADNVERIEILRGPGSALYGSNAMGGVINVITKRGQETAFTEVAASAGSYDTQLYRVSHGWKTGALDYFLTGSRVRTDGYMNNEDGSDRDWSAENVTGNLGWTLSADSELRLFLGNYDGEGTDDVADREAQKDYQDLRYTLKWSEDLDARLSLRVYRNGEHHHYAWKGAPKGNYAQYTIGGELQQSLWLDDSHLLTLGVDVRREDVDADEVTGDVSENMSTTAVYCQDEIFLSDAFQITAGARYDYSADYGDELSPRLGLLYRLGDDTELFASANRAYRAPSLSDRYARIVFFGLVFEGNPDLDPETMTAYEIGTRHRFSKKLQAELAVFRNDIKDYWDYMFDAVAGVFRNENVARVKSYGVETGLRYQITDGLSGFLNYSYTKATYEEYEDNAAVEDNVLEDLARNKASMGLDFRKPDGLSVSLKGRYVGSRYTDAGNTSDTKLDRHVIVDLRAQVPITENLTATVSVDNLFNTGYRDLPRNLQAGRQPGRMVMVGCVLRF